MLIRPLAMHDAVAFQAIRLERVQESPAAFSTSYAEEAAKSLEDIAAQLVRGAADGSFALGAFEADALVGIIGVSRHERVKLRHKADVWGMYVRPPWRGCGVGGALLDAAIESAKALAGLRQLSLSVTSDNAPARDLYVSRGFVTYGVEREGLRADGISYDMDHMQLMLVSR